MSQPERAWPATRTVGRIAGVVLAPAAVAHMLTSSPEPAAGITHGGDALGAALALAETLPLLVIHRLPRAAAIVCFGAVVASSELGYVVGSAGLASILSVGLAVAETSRRDGIAVTALGALTLVVVVVMAPGGVPWVSLVVNVLVVGIAAALGASIRGQRELATALAERARELDALREARTREAVAQERLRIAREVHDTVGHALAAMTLHVRLAQRSLERDPTASAQSLAEIAALASGALAETRDAVGQIRGAEHPALRPQPTLDDLTELVDRVRVPGIDVVIDETGGGPAPAHVVQTAAFRIVQESLSNVVKHARPAHVRIRVDRSDAELRVEVHDDGKGANGPWQPGNGLLGMHERAEALGGTLEAGPAPYGGWFRRGFRVLLEDESDIEVVGEAADGVQAVALARRRAATLVLMDIRMPRMDGLEATRHLAGPGIRDPIDVLVLTTFDLDEYVFGALQAGAAGFLLKDAEPEAIFAAIRTVASGHGLIAPQVTRRLIARFAEVSPQHERRSLTDTLSGRERDVLLLVAQGHSNAEIARILSVEEATVKKHVSRILGKLDLRSRVQAVIFAYETGLVTPGVRRRPS